LHAGADAIAVTGSVISAPPPLRQCDKGGYYKHPDAATALEEAQVSRSPRRKVHDAESGGGGALAPQLPRAFRVGPNQGGDFFVVLYNLGVYLH